MPHFKLIEISFGINPLGTIKPDVDMVKVLQEFVKATVAPYKYPRAIEFRNSLPRTETGKLQRFRLRT